MEKHRKMTRVRKGKGNIVVLLLVLVILVAVLSAFVYYQVIDNPFADMNVDHSASSSTAIPVSSSTPAAEETPVSSSTPAAEETTSGSGSIVISSGSLTISFLELGNWYAGDCTFIKAGDTDILIDAGSRSNSIPVIQSFVDQYCTDGKLEYVIVTHAHQDHIAGFAGTAKTDSIFDLYECGTIIDFAGHNTDSAVYERYESELADEIANGAIHYTAREVRESGNYVFDLADGITMTILDSYYYYNTASDENDYSVCTLITQGDRNFLFTGDLEKSGEKYLTEMNDLPQVELFKGGHHGSYSSSSETLLEVIQPKSVCICCCAGSNEYTDAAENQFPSQAAIDRIAKYTDLVYVTTLSVSNEKGNKQFTSMNGNITVHSETGTEVYFTFSGSSLKLKETEWFRENRTCPEEWK